MSLKDHRNTELSTSNRTLVTGYEKAVELLAGYYLDPLAAIDGTLAEDPDFVSGHVFRGALGLLAFERAGQPLVEAAVEQGTRLAARANDRERRHLAGLRAWLDGEMHRANELFGKIVLDYPTDLLAIQIAHITDFALGQQRLLRDRIAHALPAWTPGLPGRGFVLGMLAFGLEETNLFEQAEETGRRALDIDGRDPWAVHAVTHVHEMNGRVADGIDWLKSRVGDWAPNNGFAFHNFWHLALFHLENGETNEVLRLLDEQVWRESSSSALELVDAAALVWRLHLRGVNVRYRAAYVADVFDQPIQRGFYAFNDAHIVMALLAGERLDEARRVVAELERSAGEDGSNAQMVREVGLPLSRALVLFGEERYDKTVEILWPLRQIAQRFGGSNAQRDVIDQTLGVAAIRAGLGRMAGALAEERRLLRPRSPWANTLREEIAA
jgi:hypothetical protein